MTEFLPKDVREGLAAAHRLAEKKKSRLRVQVGDAYYQVLRRWENGFSVASEDAPQLRGLVDLYDGSRHLYRCLIVTSEEDNGTWSYDYKRATAATDAHPLDFVRDENAPIALLPDNRRG